MLASNVMQGCGVPFRVRTQGAKVLGHETTRSSPKSIARPADPTMWVQVPNTALSRSAHPGASLGHYWVVGRLVSQQLSLIEPR